MNYAKVINGVIENLGEPTYIKEGRPLTDEELADLNWFRIYSGKPAFNPSTQRLVRRPFTEWTIGGGEVFPTYDVHDIPFNDIKRAAIQRINDEYEHRTDFLVEGYPDNEQKSWPIQIKEAEYILTGTGRATPWIDAAAEVRGVTREELAQLIQQQDEVFRSYHGLLTGSRQLLRNMIEAVTPETENGAETLANINWPPLQVGE